MLIQLKYLIRELLKVTEARNSCNYFGRFKADEHLVYLEKATLVVFSVYLFLQMEKLIH